MTARAARTWVTVAVLAVRPIDGEGWELVETTRTGAARDDGLRALGFDPATAREILIFTAGRRGGAHDLAVCRSDTTASVVLRESWVFDEPTRCWRAPDEPVTEPDRPALPAERVTLALDPPELGWLDATLSAAEQTVTISVSFVFDPFPDMVAWLEAIAAGGHPRLVIDLEGKYVGLHVWPAQDGCVRFAVERMDETDRWSLDVTVPRHRLVADVYAALIAFWERPDVVAGLSRWLLIDEDDDDNEVLVYSLRSPTLDSLIAG